MTLTILNTGFIRLINILLGIVLIGVVINLFGAASYGNYVYVLAIINLPLFAMAGVSKLILKAVSEQSNSLSNDDVSNNDSLISIIKDSIFYVVLICFFLFYLDIQLEVDGLVYGPYIFLVLFASAFLFSILTALGKPVLASGFETLLSFSRFIFIFFSLFTLGDSGLLPGFLLGQTIGLLIIFFSYKYELSKVFVCDRFSIKYSYIFENSNFFISSLGLGAVWRIFSSLDKLLIESVAGLSSLAVYTVITTIVGRLVEVANTVIQVISPKVFESSILTKKDLRVWSYSHSLNILFFIIFVSVFEVYGQDFLLLWLGSEFADNVFLYRWVFYIAGYALAFTSINSLFFLAKGYHLANLLIHLFSLSFFIFSSLFFINDLQGFFFLYICYYGFISISGIVLIFYMFKSRGFSY